MSYLEQLMNDSELYFASCLKIKDKKADIIPFVINASQKRLKGIIDEHYTRYPNPRTRPTLFIIILKARQQGMSTYTEAEFFKRITLGTPEDPPNNKVAMVISYDEDSSKNINEMAQRFYQHLPEILKPMNRPARGKGLLFENPTRDRWEFEKNPGLQSKFLIETAQNTNAGSSYTLNYLHVSELAKWNNAETTMLSLLQAVPDYNGIVVIESTANGIGNYFHKLWAKAKKGENNYVPLFIPWHEHQEYSKPFLSEDEKREFIASMDEVERHMLKTYKLTYEQIHWARHTKKTKCEDSWDLFKQEYPSNDNEAFLTSGTPVFNVHRVQERIQYLEELYQKEPFLQGELSFKTDANGDPLPKGMKFVENPKGWLKIYRMPEDGVPYVIGGDTAEGGKDWSVGQVLDNTTGEQVATWRAHTDTDLYAKQMYALGHFYNYALIAIETNFDLHPVKELQRLKYHKQYVREAIDSITRRKQEKYGFQTTRKTRGPMIGELVEIVRDEIELINDLDTLYEMLTFVRNDAGRPEAQEGEHDDMIMALAIAHRAREQQKMTRKVHPKMLEGFYTPGEMEDLGMKPKEIIQVH